MQYRFRHALSVFLRKSCASLSEHGRPSPHDALLGHRGRRRRTSINRKRLAKDRIVLFAVTVATTSEVSLLVLIGIMLGRRRLEHAGWDLPNASIHGMATAGGGRPRQGGDGRLARLSWIGVAPMEGNRLHWIGVAPMEGSRLHRIGVAPAGSGGGGGGGVIGHVFASAIGQVSQRGESFSELTILGLEAIVAIAQVAKGLALRPRAALFELALELFVVLEEEFDRLVLFLGPWSPA